MRFNLFLVCLFCIFFFSVNVSGREHVFMKDTSEKKKAQYGVASYYSDKFIGKKTANGEIFSQEKLTAAHNSLPLGTYIKVTNLRNHKSVKVKINDRLHRRNKRLVDLSKAAARKLGFMRSGITRVKVQVIE